MVVVTEFVAYVADVAHVADVAIVIERNKGMRATFSHPFDTSRSIIRKRGMF